MQAAAHCLSSTKAWLEAVQPGQELRTCGRVWKEFEGWRVRRLIVKRRANGSWWAHPPLLLWTARQAVLHFLPFFKLFHQFNCAKNVQKTLIQSSVGCPPFQPLDCLGQGWTERGCCCTMWWRQWCRRRWAQKLGTARGNSRARRSGNRLSGRHAKNIF